MEIQFFSRHIWRNSLMVIAIGILSLKLAAQDQVSEPKYDDSLRVVRFALKHQGAAPIPKDLVVKFAHNSAHGISLSPQDSVTYNVVAPLPEGVFPGPNLVEIRFKGKSLWKDAIDIPNPEPNTDAQPLVNKVEPLGGFVGRSISLTGKNFGDNLNNIYVWLGDKEGHPYDADFNPVPASYLSSPDATGNQEIRFYYPDIPQDLLHGDEKNPKFWLSRQHRMWVFVNGQPSATAKMINLVNSNYQWQIFMITVGIFVVIGLGMWWVFRNRKGTEPRPWYGLVLDGYNQFSLPKLQVLAWTLLLAFGYTYYVLMRWLVMDDGSIPDFPGSLLVLLGVTSGGALISMTQNNNDVNRTRADQPSLRNLIYEGDQLSLSRLQLILFTIIAMTLYITYLADDQLVFTGMPEVPTNLLLLMGISQGGAIAGKNIESSESANLRAAAAPVNASAPSGDSQGSNLQSQSNNLDGNSNVISGLGQNQNTGGDSISNAVSGDSQNNGSGDSQDNGSGGENNQNPPQT